MSEDDATSVNSDGTKVLYPAYCPSHLAIHESYWCTTQNHVSLADCADLEAAHAEARRRGYCFFHDDVENLRDSADRPLVGDVVGDKRCLLGSNFHPAYLREVVEVTDDHVVWKRPDTSKAFKTSRKSWRVWARGSWRCSPMKGNPTNRRWRDQR